MAEIETVELDGIGIGAVKPGKSTSNSTTVEIVLKRIGPSPPARLTVPSTIKVHELRKLVAQNGNLNVENLSLVWRGNVLHDNRNGDDSVVKLSDGDSLIVAVKPKPPPKHVRDDDSESDEDEEEMKFQIPQSIRGWKRRLFIILREKLRVPDILLKGFFSLSMKMWVFIVLWFILAHFANKFDLGPLFLLATGFAIIFYNLGHRQPGDASAYSIFNEDFRELPGTLNADRLDRDIRAGQF